MASVDSVREDAFLSHVERVRSEILTKFIRAHKILQDRESDLLAELQRLVDEYTGERITQQINELSVSKDALRDALKGNENKLIFDQTVVPIDARIKELENKFKTAKHSYKSVSLEWSVEFEKKLSVAGDILLNAAKKRMRDYKEIGDPIAVFGKHSKEGSSPNVFCYPNGISVNPVNSYIYICDGGYNRVQVYNNSFVFVYQFSENISSPACICIKQDKVYVTQYSSHCLNVYSTEGKYLNSVGMKGKKELEFEKPRGLDISTDKHRIYIAEFDNDRVQCLNLDLKFNSFIDNILGAKDVKLTSDEIVVLSSRNPCVSLYAYSHQLIREMIPKGEGNPVVLANYFILDESLNIIITDSNSHCVCVFNFGGELIHRFGGEGEKGGYFRKPTGLSVNVEGRIVVASENPGHCIQVF